MSNGVCDICKRTPVLTEQEQEDAVAEGWKKIKQYTDICYLCFDWHKEFIQL